MEPILSVEEMKRMDQLAVEELRLPSICLMENAGRGCAEAISDFIDDHKIQHVAILCGAGNNGGDGFVIARALANMGLIVDCFATCDLEMQSPDAKIMRQVVEAMGLPLAVLKAEEELPDLSRYDLIIDALLGTGLKGAARGLYAGLIDEVDDCMAKVISIDIPSGLHGDTGEVLGNAITADMTLTMAAPKRGLVMAPGREHLGVMHVVDIGYMPALFTEGKEWVLPDEEDLQSLLPHRAESGHKGDFGKVLVVAGSEGMVGAALLCAGATLRSGAGMVKIACPAALQDQVVKAMPEVMTIPFEADACFDDLQDALEWADAVAVGPGLGREKKRMQVVRELVAKSELPVVLDADGLFAFNEDASALSQRESDLLVTPHHGEMASLCGVDSPYGQSDLVDAGLDLCSQAELTLMLKGAPSFTIIPDGQVFLNDSGNSGMATAGSGDILTGLLAGLVAQGLSCEDASILGAHLHGIAGDLCASNVGQRGMTAVDLLMHLPLALQSFESGHHHDDTDSTCEEEGGACCQDPEGDSCDCDCEEDDPCRQSGSCECH